jgi:hypothetical protein
MEGLIIRKKVTPPTSPTPTRLTDIIVGVLLLVALLIALPFLLAMMLFGMLREKFFPSKPVMPTEPRPIITYEVPNAFFPLRYHYIMSAEISEDAWNYFDDEPLIIYQPAISNDFFKGYFSDFKIESPRGIFVQRVNFNSTLTDVESMPLCFFNYTTQESEELLDLEGYTLHTLERPNRFIITATNRDDTAEFAASQFELEIILTDALYSPPEEFELSTAP